MMPSPRRARLVVLCLLLLACAIPLAAVAQDAVAQDAGQADGEEQLRLALEAKLQANDILDRHFMEALAHCERALDLGLTPEGEKFCKKLYASALLERGITLGRLVQAGPPGNLQQLQRLQQIRMMALADLERAAELDPNSKLAQLTIGQLQAAPGGDRQSAMLALTTAIRLAKDDPATLARAYLARSDLHEQPAEKLADLDAAVKADPQSEEAVRARGVLRLEQGEFERALVDLDAAAKLDPGQARTHELRGMALAAQQKLKEAKAAFSRAIALEPDERFAYIQRARVELLQGDGEGAVRDLDKVLAGGLPAPEVLLLRAGAYEQTGNVEKALEDVDAALQLRPGMPEALRARAMLLAGSGKVAEAIGDLETLRKRSPDDTQTLLQLGILYYTNRQMEDAIATFTTIIRRDENNSAAYRARADAYLQLGRHAAARDDYLQSLKGAPEDDHVLNNLAWLLATSPDDKVRDGKRAVELALRACKVTEYKEAHILSTLAAGYAEAGDFQNAVKWSKRAVELGEGEIKAQLEKELASYRAGKPWRERLTPDDE